MRRRASSNRQLVRTAHMELATPSLADTIAECAQLGASRVIVAPFFLSRRVITESLHVFCEASVHNAFACCIDPMTRARLSSSRGRHITEDIPALVRAAAAEHPELECVIADPLGALPAFYVLTPGRANS